MAKDLSIVFKAVDNLTNTVNQMRNSTRNLTKDITDFKKIKEEAFEKKAEVKLETQRAKQELKELEKAVKSGQEGAEKAFTAQQKKVFQLEDAYKNLSKTIKDASGAERKLAEDMSRTKNTVNSQGGSIAPGSGGKLGGTKQMMAAIAGTDLAKMVGTELVNYGAFQMSRTFGANAGETISNVGGGAVQGAAAGAMLGSVIPGLGTAVGAAVGGAVGAATGALKDNKDKQEKLDDAFREDVRGLYTMTKEQSKSELDDGIKLASKREQDLISFGTLFGGDDIAKSFMKNAQKFASETPFETNDLVDVAKKLSAYGYKPDEIVDKDGNGIMKTVGNAGSALGMGKEDMSWIATSLGRMRASGKTSLEFINPLVERGIPAIEYLAKASGNSQKQIYEMISKGQIDGKQAVQVITDYMNKSYAGNMDKASKTTAGLQSNLEDQQAAYNMAKGDGYNKERRNGLEGQIKFHEANGKNIEKANEALGVFQAKLDNLKDEKMNLAMKEAMDSKEFNEADEAKKGMLIQQARVKGMLEFRKTDEFKVQQEADLVLVQGIQNDASINQGYYQAGLKFGNQMTKGIKDSASQGMSSVASSLQSFWDKIILRKEVEVTTKPVTGPLADVFYNRPPAGPTQTQPSGGGGYKGILNGYGGDKSPSLPPLSPFSPFTGHAVGLDRVPYNNYPALLHEGERVLTKAQVNTESSGTSGIVINMNNTVRNEADIDKIAKALVSELTKHQSSYGGGQ